MLGWVQGQESQTSITVIQLPTFCLQLRVNFLKYNFYPCSKNPQLPQRPDHIKSRSLCLNVKAFSNPTQPIHLCYHPSHAVLLPVPAQLSSPALWATAHCSPHYNALYSFSPTGLHSILPTQLLHSDPDNSTLLSLFSFRQSWLHNSALKSLWGLFPLSRKLFF